MTDAMGICAYVHVRWLKTFSPGNDVNLTPMGVRSWEVGKELGNKPSWKRRRHVSRLLGEDSISIW